jgi:cell wall-associated NlpC family hydrolase
MIKNKLLISLIAVVIAHVFIACSSSSGTIRYGSDEKVKITKEDTSVRFPTDNVAQVEDTTMSLDDDTQEFQDPSDLPEDENAIDLQEALKKLQKNSAGADLTAIQSTSQEAMIMEIIKYLNTPYKYGGNSMNGIDCSAFTQSVYHDALEIELNRSARQQYQQGETISNLEDLKFGDLVFFNTRRRVRPGHVGIYIGDNLFAHASSKNGVTISSLDHTYYSKRFMGARRIETNGVF